MGWKPVWSVLRRVVLWTVLGLVGFIGLLAAYDWLRPVNRHQIVIQTGQEKMTGVFISMCGIEYPVDIKPGRITSEIPDRCEGAPTILMESASAQYWCFAPYITGGLPAEIYPYRIENGKCEALDSQKRAKAAG